MKKIIKKYFITGFLLLAIIPSSVFAAVELRYVNARQAYTDNFFGKTVAQLIYDESNQHHINPRVILTILQRESSSITQSTPSSTSRLAWPMFYNYDERMADCLNGDETACNDSKYNKPDYSYRAENYGGVGQQIAYATAQFSNLDGDSNDANGRYCEDSRVVSVDSQNITTDNNASCALYKYTPHVSAYDTSSAFYTRWVQWWGGTPNGGVYSQTNIISEANFRDYTSMSATEINNFLIDENSWLANYTISEYISVPYPAIAAPASTDDITAASLMTRDDSYLLSGSKRTDLTAYSGSTIVGVKAASTWSYTFPSPVGTKIYIIEYKDDNGGVVETKPITITHYKPGDTNGDDTVDISDLSRLGDSWGQHISPGSGADFNSDGIIDIADLSILGDNWGK